MCVHHQMPLISTDTQHSITVSPHCTGQFPLEAHYISLLLVFPSQRHEILSCSLITKRAQFILFLNFLSCSSS
jgi:hypothetical protein